MDSATRKKLKGHEDALNWIKTLVKAVAAQFQTLGRMGVGANLIRSSA